MAFEIFEGDFTRPNDKGIRQILDQLIEHNALPPNLDIEGATWTVKNASNTYPESPISRSLEHLTDALLSRRLLEGLIEDGGGFMVQGSGRDREWAVQIGQLTISNIPRRFRQAFSDPANVQPIIDHLRLFLEK